MGAIGVGVGAIIHNQIGAIVTLLAWGLLVENLVFGLVPSVGISCRHARQTRCWASGPITSSRQAPARSRYRLGRRIGACRHRPVRSPGHQLTTWATGMGSRLRPTSDNERTEATPGPQSSSPG